MFKFVFNLIINIYYFVVEIFHPNMWIQLYTYNKKIDNWCKEQYEKGFKFKKINDYKAFLNEKEIWTESRPFGFYFINNEIKYENPYRYYLLLRPSRRMIRLIYKELDKFNGMEKK